MDNAQTIMVNWREGLGESEDKPETETKRVYNLQWKDDMMWSLPLHKSIFIESTLAKSESSPPESECEAESESLAFKFESESLTSESETLTSESETDYGIWLTSLI